MFQEGQVEEKHETKKFCLFVSRRASRKQLTTALFVCFKKGLFPKEAEEKHEIFVFLFQEKKGLFPKEAENNSQLTTNN